MLKIVNLRMGLNSKQTLEQLVARKLMVAVEEILLVSVIKKSIDARKKNNICLVYAVVVQLKDNKKIIKLIGKDKDISLVELEQKEKIEYGVQAIKQRPVIVGAGPAGLIATYFLAKHGYRPLLLERGKAVLERSQDVALFWQKGLLDLESNVQFGEGGAGTFSDGKLTTRISDPIIREVLEIFVEQGAPQEIIYKHKPHIGTDILKKVVTNISKSIRQLGGEIRFSSKVTDLEINADKLVAITVNNQEKISCENLILAIGHSARDTYKMLLAKNVQLQNKPLAVGVRIEHRQDYINKLQYGEYASSPLLDVADYSVIYQDKENKRAVYSFCMCPGGKVVASTNQAGCVVTNGMSFFKRDNELANAALVVTVDERDYGTEALAVIEFQEKYEQKAYLAAGEDYFAPAQDAQSFLNDSGPSLAVDFKSSYLPGVRACALQDILPISVVESLKKALRYYEQRMPGFTQNALLIGVETRTSAPVRILRDEKTRQSLNVQGLYPTGEGAGYAGGIMSAAVDGYHAAVAIMKQYRKFDDM